MAPAAVSGAPGVRRATERKGWETGRWLILLPAFLCLARCASPITTTRDPRIQHAAAEAGLLEVPFYRQKSWTGCGAAVLAGVLSYWGQGVRPEHIAERFPAEDPTRGYTLAELKRIARAHHMHAFAFPSDIATISAQLAAGRPVITPLEIEPGAPLMPAYDHYVIVVGLHRQRGRIFLVDPQIGVHMRSLTDFDRQWRAKSRALLLVAP